MLTAILVLLLIAVVSYSVYFRWTRRKFFAAISSMKGPTSLPFIGSGYRFVGQTSPEQMHKVMTSLTGQCKSPTPIWSGQNLILVVHSPEHAQVVLKSEDCLDRAYFNRYFQLDHGMLTTSVSSWKSVRKLLNMSLSPSMINSYIPIVNQKSRIMVEQVAKLVGKSEQNVYHDIAKWALDMICATVLGLDINVQTEGTGVPYLKVVNEYLTLVTKRMSMGMTTGDSIPNFFYNLTQDGKNFTKAAQTFRSVSNIIMERKAPFDQSDMDDFAANPRKPRILLDMIYHLAAADPEHMSNESIAEHLDEIIFAGQDAMADVISKIILMLAMHPDIQERVHQEIVSVFPDESSVLSQEDCSKLTYTEMFCKETLRLFPASPFIGRRVDADVKLDDRHTLPKGAEVIVAFFKMHRDPAIWGPDADWFDPDNFMPEKVAQRHPYAFLPFSAGSRNCLGFKFAWYPVKIVLAHLIRSYRFRTSLKMDDLVLQNWSIIILKIAQGCPVQLEKRTSCVS
uniref:Putative cytochrome n=1 Tax=Culex tarsalis TaxID=7177 RepID=A0A1Q3FSZ3_CULTA